MRFVLLLATCLAPLGCELDWSYPEEERTGASGGGGGSEAGVVITKPMQGQTFQLAETIALEAEVIGIEAADEQLRWAIGNGEAMAEGPTFETSFNQAGAYEISVKLFEEDLATEIESDTVQVKVSQ